MAPGSRGTGRPLSHSLSLSACALGGRKSVGAHYDQHEYAAEKRDAIERWERRAAAHRLREASANTAYLLLVVVARVSEERRRARAFPVADKVWPIEFGTSFVS